MENRSQLSPPGPPDEVVGDTFPDDESKSCSPVGAEPRGPSIDGVHLKDFTPAPKHEHSMLVVALGALIDWLRT